MDGIIKDANKAYKRKVAVNPIAKHYEEPGEPPYIKYVCPVCRAVGNNGVSISHRIPNCPLCNVAFNWEREPEVGDTVIITENGPWAGAFEKGETCRVVKEVRREGADHAWYWLKSKKRGAECLYPKEAFSILEESEED